MCAAAASCQRGPQHRPTTLPAEALDSGKRCTCRSVIRRTRGRGVQGPGAILISGRYPMYGDRSRSNVMCVDLILAVGPPLVLLLDRNNSSSSRWVYFSGARRIYCTPTAEVEIRGGRGGGIHHRSFSRVKSARFPLSRTHPADPIARYVPYP